MPETGIFQVTFLDSGGFSFRFNTSTIAHESSLNSNLFEKSFWPFSGYEMDPLDFVYCISLFLAPIVIYILLSKPKKYRTYSESDWCHCIKAIIAKPYVRKFQQNIAKGLQYYSDEGQEKPRQNLNDNESDSQIICGADTKGNYFFLKISLRHTLHVELSIEYRSNEGKIYRLPNEPQVLLSSIAARNWKAAGLNIEILQPFRRLRITYNGFMRCCSKNINEDVEGEVEHVRFHFLWNCGSAPLRYPGDLSINLFTEAIAKEPWKDGDWIKMLGSSYGYEQYGALNGFFRVESLNEDKFLYLPSWRRRSIGPGERQELRRDLFIFGILKDGTAFSVGAKSIQSGCTQIRYGSILTSTGHLHSLSSNDIQLENLAEIPNAFSLHFQANGKVYKCICHVNTYKTSSSRNTSKHGWILKTTTAECDVNSDQARAILYFWYQDIAGHGEDLPRPLVKPRQIQNPEEVFTTPLLSLECLDHDLTGGKGNSLGIMSCSLASSEFEVPPGFVITTTSFRYQIWQNSQLSKAVEDLAGVCYGRIPGDIEDSCKETSNVFAQTPIVQKLVDEIKQQIEALKSASSNEEWKWAVRSSGLDEDSEELSAAGQNSTFLGCITDEDVLKAISACWGSLFSFQSVEYRRRHGIPVNTEMAVVVQKMVPADAAGVLFTCHPTSGNSSQMVITSNYGLGESVVSGSSDPDLITLSRTYTDNVTVLKSEVGGKKTKIVYNENKEGIKEMQIGEEKSKKLSITEEQALKLGGIGVLLEKRFGGPRDVEWAFWKENLYVLQSRPITALNSWTDWELEHEFDTPIYSEQSAYTRANVGEVVKGAITVLSQLCTRLLDTALQIESYNRVPNPYSFGPMVIRSHTIFMDMLNYMYSAVTDKLSLQTQTVDLAIFGHSVLDENLLRTALKRHGVNKGLKTLKYNFNLFQKAWNNSKVLQTIFRYNNYWQILFKPSDSPLRILEKIEAQFDKLIGLSKYHLNTSMTSIVYQMMAMITMTENSDSFRDEHYTDIALLLSTNSSVESVEVPVMLEQITTNIRSSNMAEEFMKIKPEDGMQWLKEKCPKVKGTLDEFLAIHGHRAVKEFELKEKTWGMDPSIIIAMLQANCASETITKKAKNLTVEETIAKLTSPKKKITRYILKFLVSKCREAVAGREKSKSELVRGVNRFRLAYTELGKEMALQGFLPEEDLVFHLTHEELKAVASQKSPGLIAKAVRRKRLYDKWDKFQFPEISYGLPVPEDKDDFDGFTVIENAVKLKGTPVYEGNIIARACVVTDIKEARKSVQPGDILITISTDIAWSPYFPMLSGVVTELGGLISHGAVVAREYGLPCVVGVQNATKYFKTGDKIKLSGKLGLLELVE
ncbi:hypothetical protein Trydic_g23295 [Trypoxylus dichotomus]